MAGASPQHWLVTLPNRRVAEDADTAFAALSRSLSSSGNIAEPFRLDVPKLLVGTLDSLMSLSDELGKHDSSVESIVRKIERQYSDLAGRNAEPLRVGSAPAAKFVEGFVWDMARFPVRRPLPDLVSLILAGVSSVEEELKQFAVVLADANQRLAALNRKKGSNLTMMPLEEVISPEMAADFIDSEYLKTVCVVVPKSAEADFVTSYASIGNDIAGFGGPDWSVQTSQIGKLDNNYGPYCDRRAVSGSPAVPGSHKKLLQQGDQVLYSIVLLKGQYEGGYVDGDEFQPGTYVDFFERYQAAAKEQRFVVREYTPAQTGTGISAAEEQAELEIQVKANANTLKRWCETHFGEVFSAWVHLKVVRCFVESVLRYGLPPDFTLAVLRIGRNKEGLVGAAIDKLLGVDTQAGQNDDPDDGDYHDYCRLEFAIFANT